MITVGVYAVPDPGARPPREVHDHALAILSEGRVRHHVELERISRKKHDNRLPAHLEGWLASGLLQLPEAFRLVTVDNCEGAAFESPGGVIAVSPEEGPLGALRPATCRFAGRRVESWACSHELAHIGSHLPFVGRFAEGSLLVHIDGGASRSNVSAWQFRGGRIVPLAASWELKSAVAHFFLDPLSFAILGLPMDAELELAGKLMGYASYGEANDELLAWLRRNDWFRRCEPVSFFAAARSFGVEISGFDLRDPFLMAIAACMQRDLEEHVLAYLERFQRQTGARELYLSGGTALNVQLNARIERRGLFDRVHVPPCCNDTGLALGGAALLELDARGEVEPTGPFLNDLGAPADRVASESVLDDVADRLAEGQVVALFTGAAEIGPRALGHRSLLAHPGSAALRDRVSCEMKRREWYRPVAPIALASEAEALFEHVGGSRLARFMLGAYRVRPEVAARIPGVVHVDGTARAQVVEPGDPGMETVAGILSAARRRHGIPCLVNTSFNCRGEPMVHTAEQAMAAARELGVDAILIEGRLVPLDAAERAAIPWGAGCPSS